MTSQYLCTTIKVQLVPHVQRSDTCDQTKLKLSSKKELSCHPCFLEVDGQQFHSVDVVTMRVLDGGVADVDQTGTGQLHHNTDESVRHLITEYAAQLTLLMFTHVLWRIYHPVT